MTLLLVDGNNLFMKAWYATQSESMTADGESTAAMVAFASGLARYIRTEHPDRMVVCWDGGGSAYRLRLLPSYKANRGPNRHSSSHLPRAQVREFLALAGVFQVERTGFEADDLIAKYWQDAAEVDGPVVIVSEDKDFLQLAGATPGGSRCEIVRSPGERWNEAGVTARMGARPDQLPSVMALTGDESDNVIGVPGIGPKRAVALLEGAGWHLESIEHPEVAQMLQQVLLNRVLVNLRMPVPGLLLPPPPPFKPTGPGSVLFAEFVDFLTRYQLKGLLGKLQSSTLWSEDDRIAAHVVSNDAA